jgi:hypothetical protein
VLGANGTYLRLSPELTKLRLSKSQYTKGLQCHKSLWLYQHRRELAAKPDFNRQAIFNTGHEVGNLARDLFPGGTEIEFDASNFDAMIDETRRLIDQGEQVIYEATFRASDVLVMADILVRNGDFWDFYEVKGSTRLKPYHKHDAAIQWFVINSQIPLGSAFIAHLNNRYVRSGELDVQQLFTLADITETVLDLQAAIAANLTSMKAMLEGGEPDIPIGTQCNNPFECDFKSYCWEEVPFPSVLELYNMRGNQRFELFHEGLVAYEDVKNLPLTPTQALQVKTAISGEAHIDRYRLGEYINSAVYPINFLDFETLQNAIPKFDGQRPYLQIPFQYSLHILHEDGHLEHKEFLANELTDPRPMLVEQLLRDVTTTGTIVAQYMSVEIGVINKLASEFPQHEAVLHGMVRRFIDLITPFKGLMYYHPDFNGDFSIKSLLPALFPDDVDADYKQLEIQDGRMAMNIYASLDGVEDPGERERIRASLLAYCRLDTLAMVKIWRRLNEVIA